MDHFYQNIQGWFDFEDVYKEIVDKMPSSNQSHFVEVGSWLGKSSAFMAVEIINSGKSIKFDCVDTWEGSEEHTNYDIVLKDELYNNFIINMKPVKHIYTPIRKFSVEASKLYANNSLDFVFIDAAHDYENVKNDIIAWMPKVKQGGILAGHDILWWDSVKQVVDTFLVNYTVNNNSWIYQKN